MEENCAVSKVSNQKQNNNNPDAIVFSYQDNQILSVTSLTVNETILSF